MIKQRDISQIQCRIGDIDRDGIVHTVAAGQGSIAAIGHLQGAQTSDGIGEGAVKTAQRQNILRACQCDTG
ncbi:Uncharacterised protein [Yersinia massiliensis]|nr:Uncharacterised protein [Yersinia massiliensis]